MADPIARGSQCNAAQQQPVWILETMEAVADKADALAQELIQLVAPSRAEPGCLQYELYREEEESHKFSLIMGFKSEDAYNNHLSADHIQAFMTKFPDNTTLYTNVVETRFKKLG